MDTITWHENMHDYFRNLSFRNHNMGCRIDPMMLNDELLASERKYSNKSHEYLEALKARYDLT